MTPTKIFINYNVWSWKDKNYLMTQAEIVMERMGFKLKGYELTSDNNINIGGQWFKLKRLTINACPRLLPVCDG